MPAADIERSARTLREARPVAFYAWCELEQYSNTTPTIRAINQLYALIGDLDAPGGNVLIANVPANRIDGVDLLAPGQRGKALGVAQRPLGPPGSSTSPAKTSTPRPSRANRIGRAGW